jgi:hypothetical protein
MILGVKTNLCHFYKTRFLNFEPFLTDDFKVSKKCLYDFKTLSSDNLTLGIKKAQNWMLTLNNFDNENLQNMTYSVKKNFYRHFYEYHIKLRRVSFAGESH